VAQHHGGTAGLHGQGVRAAAKGHHRGLLYQLQVDIDVYNDANRNAEPIQTCLDFTDDVAERKLAEGRDKAA
jgi:hypothetical protein